MDDNRYLENEKTIWAVLYLWKLKYYEVLHLHESKILIKLSENYLNLN